MDNYGELKRDLVDFETINKGDFILLPVPLYSVTEYGHKSGIFYETYKICKVTKITPKRTKIHVEDNRKRSIEIKSKERVYLYERGDEIQVKQFTEKARILQYLFRVLDISRSGTPKSIKFTKLPCSELRILCDTIEKYKTEYCED